MNDVAPSSRNPGILIVEPAGAGHHPRYVAEILREIRRRDAGPVTLLTTRTALGQPLGEIEAMSGVKCEIATFAEQPGHERIWRPIVNTIGINSERWYSWELKAIRDWFRQNDGESRYRAVLIPYLDWSHLTPLAFSRRPFGSVPFGGIFIGPVHHMRDFGISVDRGRYREWRDRKIYHRYIRHPDAGALFTIDPYFSRSAGGNRVIAIPDPALISDTAASRDLRREFDLDRDAVIMLIYGGMGSKRKTVREAVLAAADDRVPRKLVMVVAGYDDENIALPEPAASTLRSQNRLVRLNHYIDDQLERSLFEAADFVWVCYRHHHGSSGVLVNAGHMGKPTIACKSGLIGKYVGENPIGLCADPGRYDEVVTAMIQLTEDDVLRRQLGAAAREYFAPHTARAFAAPIVDWLARTRN